MGGEKSIAQATRLFRQQGGILRTAEAMRLGIHPRTLYAMRDSGVLERLGRGLYRLADMPPMSNPDLVTVALKVPRGVVCLVTALAFHELTVQVPHVVDVALCKGDERPRLAYPPLRVFWFSRVAWREGIETHRIDGTEVRVYSREKSVADSFKFRRQIGLGVAIEALRAYRESSPPDFPKLLHYAGICRVERVIKPYLESLL